MPYCPLSLFFFFFLLFSLETVTILPRTSWNPGFLELFVKKTKAEIFGIYSLRWFPLFKILLAKSDFSADYQLKESKNAAFW